MTGHTPFAQDRDLVKQRHGDFHPVEPGTPRCAVVIEQTCRHAVHFSRVIRSRKIFAELLVVLLDKLKCSGKADNTSKSCKSNFTSLGFLLS